MAIHVRHARLVLSYVVATLIVTSLCLGGKHRSPTAIPHSAAAQHAADVQHAAKFVLLNAVLGISAASLLFCSVGFSLAGLLLVGRREKRPAEGLHYSDQPSPEAALAGQRRETAAHTLAAANWAVTLLLVAFSYSLESLRLVLPASTPRADLVPPEDLVHLCTAENLLVCADADRVGGRGMTALQGGRKSQPCSHARRWQPTHCASAVLIQPTAGLGSKHDKRAPARRWGLIRRRGLWLPPQGLGSSLTFLAPGASGVC